MTVAPARRLLAIAALAASCLGLGFFLGLRSAPRSTSAGQSRLASAALAPSRAPDDSAAASAPRTDSISAAGNSDSWDALLRLPPTPDSEARLCARLLVLGAQNPVAALRLAQDAPTPRQRTLLRDAALQGWASRHPLAAADWALANIRYDERRGAIEAVAAGAIAQPESAVRVIDHLIAADPVLACDHGNALVTAFARSGLYDEASRFAATGPAQYRAAWLSTTYQQWATYQPQAALLALETIADPASRDEARAGLYAGWSSSDPAALVAYAQTLPHGDARLQALNDGLSQWVHRDPAAASAWMDNHDPSPDLDVGAAAIALAPALVSQKPDIATSWAESITDPELRAHTLLDLIRLWAERDPASARRYAATSPILRPDTRALALSTLDSPPEP